jgi:threonine/homoserine/homoserine lactone efflux protein
MLPSPEGFLAFTAAGLTLLLIPGPAVMYITALGLREGRRPAVAAAVGLGVGNFSHVLAATLGLSALLVSSALAFSIVKYIGAAYLIYLGIQTLRQRHEVTEMAKPVRTSTRREFRRGVIVNTFNPKVAIFFLAFFPHFIDPERGAVWSQILILGSWFVVLGIITDALYGITAGEVGVRIRAHSGLQSAMQRLSGVVYIVLGLIAALVSTDRATSDHCAR